MDQNSRIFIVANDQVFLKDARHALESAGYALQIAECGQAALGLAPQYPFELALVDVDLADISALEVCRQIRAAQPAAVVLLTGGKRQEGTGQSEDLGAGVDGFISRPISGRQLLAQLRPYLRLQQTQAALRASENRFQSFVGQASEGILMVDEQGVIVEFNLALEQMTGLKQEQAIGQTAWDVQYLLMLEAHRTPAAYDRIKALWLEAVQTGHSPMLNRPVEAVYRRADGAPRIVSQSFFPIQSATGFRIGGIARDVTEQKQTQEALEVSEAKYRQLYESMIDGYGSVDLEGHLLDYNQAYLDMLGYTAEELRQLTYIDYTPEKWRAFEAQIVAEQIMTRGYSDIYEKEYRRKDGTIFPVELHTVLVRDENGKPRSMWAIIRDISERKQAEENQRRNEANLQALISNTTDRIWAVDAGYHLIICNDPFQQNIQEAGERSVRLGDSILAGFPQELAALWRSYYDRALSGEIFSFELKLRAPGKPRYTEYHFHPIRNPDGSISGVAVSGRDITERKLAEQALRESEANFRSVFENNTVGLYRTTPDGQILMANPTLLHMLGFEDFAALGQRNLEQDYFNTSYPRSEFKRQIESQGEVKGLESAWKKEDGSFVYVLESARAVDDGAGNTLYYEGTVEDITERKKAEQALQIEQDRAQQYLDTAELILTAVTAQGKVTMINQPGCRILGYNAEELLGKDWVDGWVPARIQEEVRTALNQYMAGKVDTEYHENLVVTKSGEERMVAWHNTLLKDEQGNVTGILAAGMDITERKQAEMALIAERNLLDTLLDNVPDSIYFKDAQSRIIRSNQALTNRVGMNDPDQMIGKTDFDFFEEEHAQAAYVDEQAIIRSGQPLLDKEEEEIFLDGRVYWMSTTKMPLRDKQGQIVGTFGISRDITARKQAEKALEWERYLMRSLMANMPDAIYFKDLEGRYFLANPAMLGIRAGLMSVEEIYGKTDADFFDPETARTLAELEQAVMRTGDPIEGLEHEEKWPDRPTTWALSTKMPLRDADGSILGIFGVSRDITERKNAEALLRESEESYYNLFHNASLGIFHSTPDGRFLRANPALAHMLGYSSAEELISTVTDIKTQLYVNPDRHTKIVETATRQDDWVRAENQYRRKDGSLITASLSGRRVLNPDGTLAYLEGFVEDITQRRAIENELRQDEKRLEGLLDISQHETEDIEELLTFAVGQAIELTGSRIGYFFSYDEQTQVLTLNTRDLDVTVECAIPLAQSVYRLDETGLSGEPIRQRRPLLINDFQAPNPLKRGYPTGHVKIDRYLSIPVFSQDKIVGLLAVANKPEEYDQADIRQVTLLMNSVWRMIETKQAEERLRQSEERLRFALEAGSDGLWDDDLKNDRHYLSPRWYTMLGYQPDEFPATDAAFRSLVHPDDLPRVAQMIDDYNHGRADKYEIEFRIFSKTGQVVWILSRAKATERDGEGRPLRIVGTHTNITRRKLAEEALAASEESYRGLMRQASDGIFIADERGRYLDVNQAACDMLGYTRQEILQLSMQDVVAPEDRTLVPVRLTELSAGKSTLSIRNLYRKDHSTVLAEISGKMLEDRRMLGIVRDITERKQAEKALRASEQRLRQITESTGDFIWEMDAAGLYLYASPQVEEILGYSADELVGEKYWYDLLTPDKRDAVKSAAQNAFDNREAFRDVFSENIHKDGRPVFLESSGSPIIDPVGNLLGYRGADTDVTKRKQAEDAVRASEERFRQVAESTGDFIWEEDAGGLFLYASPAVEKILGYTPDELVGKKYWHDLLTPDSRQAIMATFQSAYSRKEAFRDILIEFAHKDGHMVMLESSGSPMLDRQGNLAGYRGADKDVTERNRDEQALKEINEQLSATLKAIPDRMFEVDRKGFTYNFFSAPEDLVDLPPEVFLGKTVDQFLAPEAARVVLDSLDEAARLGSSRGGIFKLGLGDGPHWFELSIAAKGEAAAPDAHFIAIAHDITERKQAEEAVRESEPRLKEAERMAHLGSSTWDVTNDVTIWSDEMYQITGWDHATPLPKRDRRGLLYTPESWARLEPALVKALTTAEPYDLELDLVRPDGTQRYVHVRGEAETDQSGKVEHMHGTMQDITELRLAQENLRQTHQLLNTIVDASPLAISAIDLNGHLTLWSRASERLFGWTEAEVLGHELPVIPDEMEDEAKQQIREELAGTPRTGLVCQRRRKDGTIVDISLSTAPLRDAAGNITGSMGVCEDITQRKQAEAALRESEIKFRAIFENSRDAIGVSHAGINAYVNPAYLELFGYTDSSEVVGQSLFKLVAADDRQRVAKISAGRTQGREVPANYETRGVRKDGSQFDIDIKAATYELNGKRYTLAVIRDVTERKQAEEALRRSEERYRVLAENMTDTVWMFNMDLKYTYISPSLVRQRGYTLEEINTVPLDRQVAPESFKKAMQTFNAILTPENLSKNIFLPPVTLELEIIRKDGSSFWGENTYILVRDKDGKPLGLLGTGRDITERKRTEQALRDSEQRFRTFIEQSAEAVTIVDEEGRIIEWNASRERMTGRTRQEVIGKYFWDMQVDLTPPEHRDEQTYQRIRTEIIEALQTGQSFLFDHQIDAEIIRADNERRSIRQSVFPIKTDKGFRLGGVSHDITEQKQTEALRMAKEAAEAANRAKSEFLANMSHELRTPLNAVIGFSDMLNQQYYGPLTVKQVEYVKDIHESATYLLALINDILDLSKIEAGRMDLETSPVDLYSMIKHSLVMVRERALKHALYLSSFIDPRLEPLRLMADERKVRQILYNLLANAVKFTPDGGAVDLSARLVDEVEGKDKAWAEISVTDTGIGLAEKDLERVFEAFYQVKSPEAGKTPGTGLGLSLVKRMVELHGGKVWVESQGPGKGTRFVFTLPLPGEEPGETQ